MSESGFLGLVDGGVTNGCTRSTAVANSVGYAVVAAVHVMSFSPRRTPNFLNHMIPHFLAILCASESHRIKVLPDRMG